MAGERGSRTGVKVWDLPVRLFHWALVLAIAVLFASAQLGAMPLHALAGELVLALVLFRIVWGFVGSQTARFTDFLAGPNRVLAYLRTGRFETLGHNPLGGWMVLFLLIALAVQAGLGLMSNDDVMFDGPLAHLVGSHASGIATSLHRLLFDLLAVMVALHVGAVLFHRVVKRENLIRAMVTGRKDAPAEGAAPPSFVSPLWAALLFVLAVAAVAWIVSL